MQGGSLNQAHLSLVSLDSCWIGAYWGSRQRCIAHNTAGEGTCGLVLAQLGCRAAAGFRWAGAMAQDVPRAILVCVTQATRLKACAKSCRYGWLAGGPNDGAIWGTSMWRSRHERLELFGLVWPKRCRRVRRISRGSEFKWWRELTLHACSTSTISISSKQDLFR